MGKNSLSYIAREIMWKALCSKVLGVRIEKIGQEREADNYEGGQREARRIKGSRWDGDKAIKCVQKLKIIIKI